MRVEINACLLASESDDAPDAAVGERTKSSYPYAVGVGGSHS